MLNKDANRIKCLLLYFFFSFGIISCKQPQALQSNTPSPPRILQPTETAKRPNTPPSIQNIPSTATITAVPKPTNLPPSPTITKILTPTPRSTALPKPTFLTTRNPTFEQMAAYLQSTTVRLYDPDSRTDKVVSLVLKPDNKLAWQYPTGGTQFRYEDVNSDGEADLLLLYGEPFSWGPVYLIVMLWDGSAYNQPFMVVDGTKYSGGAKFYLQDLLGDEQPELIWMAETTTGGTGYIESQYDQYVLRCKVKCTVIWHTPYVNYWDGYSQSRNHGLTTTSFDVSTDSMQIRSVTQKFDLPIINGHGSFPIRVYDTIEEIYNWNGRIYALTTSTVLEQAYSWEPEPKLEAKKNNQSARLESIYVPQLIVDGDWDVYNHYDCTVIVNEVPIGDVFQCNPFYSQLSWQDVTADNRDELVLRTISQTNQELLIWQQWGEGFRQIADVHGDINTIYFSDMTLGNVDDDPALEILAGRFGYQTDDFCYYYENPGRNQSGVCWYEITLDRVAYNWDGWKYVKTP